MDVSGRRWGFAPGPRAVAAVVAAAAVLLAALFLVPPLTGRDTEPGTRAALTELLRRRGEAVVERDRAAFLRDTAPGPFRRREAARFGNLAEVPLASYGYRLLRIRGTTADVELRYRLTGHDTGPVTAAERFTFAARDGRVTLTGDAGGTAQLWDFGPVRAVRGEHSLVLGLGGLRDLRARAAEADRAVPAVRAVWPDGWGGTVVVLVPATQRQMAELLGAPEESYAGIAAVTTAQARGASAASADRILVNPEAYRDLSAFGRQVVLTHETTHVATRRATTPATPVWLSEGFADWVAYARTGRSPAEVAPELRRDVLAGHVPQRLPGDADFSAGRDGLAQAYEMAWLACRMTAATWGQDRLEELYRAAGRGVGGERELDARMRSVLGVGLADFTARWRAYVQEELR
ncbi:hypothetical protein GCM10027168_29760 [Streptomyces capparidis]